MLHYLEAGLTNGEIPNETTLCIYVSGCIMHCGNCHYPELQDADDGDPLEDVFQDLFDLYRVQISCVCFLGEGACGDEEREQLIRLAMYVHRKGKRVGLYSGRDLKEPEEWMNTFDYVKLGSYQKQYGPLTSPDTNQRMYRNWGEFWEDITWQFWEK